MTTDRRLPLPYRIDDACDDLDRLVLECGPRLSGHELSQADLTARALRLLLLAAAGKDEKA